MCVTDRFKCIKKGLKQYVQKRLHGRLRLQPQHKLVGLWVDVFLRHVDVRDPPGRHHQAEVHTLEQEDAAVSQAAGDGGLADQGPVTSPPVVAAVLEGGARGQVALQEGLDGTGGTYTSNTRRLHLAPRFKIFQII